MGHIRTRRIVTLAVLPLVALLVAGCAPKFTGGGTIPSSDGTGVDQANFSFNYDVTDPNSGAGRAHGVYHDNYAPGYNGGVQFKFDGMLASATGPGSPCVKDGVAGVANYVSQNPNYPGSGTVLVGACDDGQPSSTFPDAIVIEVITGPYADYGNGGFLTGGNLQAHK